LGLYLTEHPLGEIADELPEYVTAYTGDLAEEQDQAKVTIGGILQGSRRVITRAGSTMLVANLEDLQGTVEVVVFPKVFQETANAWSDDAVVLVSGRVDHRDDEAKLLCEVVHSWDDAVHMGPVAFSAERDRLLRGRGRGPYGTNRPGGNGNSGGNGGAGSSGTGSSAWSPQPAGVPEVAAVPVGEPADAAVPVAAAAPVGVASVAGLSAPSSQTPIRVSPIKLRPVAPEPVDEPTSAAADASDEPSAPADAVPIQAAPAGAAASVEVVFESGAPVERLLPAIESVTQFLRGRPGPIAVVLQVSVAGATRQIRLPDRVAWDDRLVEGVRRAAELPVEVALRASQGEP